jgi:hypothetical protein
MAEQDTPLHRRPRVGGDFERSACVRIKTPRSMNGAKLPGGGIAYFVSAAISRNASWNRHNLSVSGV